MNNDECLFSNLEEGDIIRQDTQDLTNYFYIKYINKSKRMLAYVPGYDNENFQWDRPAWDLDALGWNRWVKQDTHTLTIHNRLAREPDWSV